MIRTVHSGPHWLMAGSCMIPLEAPPAVVEGERGDRVVISETVGEEHSLQPSQNGQNKFGPSVHHAFQTYFQEEKENNEKKENREREMNMKKRGSFLLCCSSVSLKPCPQKCSTEKPVFLLLPLLSLWFGWGQILWGGDEFLESSYSIPSGRITLGLQSQLWASG